jgi:hypothetical protein
VHGETAERIGDAVPGRRQFRALTGPDGITRIPNLRFGAWRLWLDGGARGALGKEITLALGSNEYVVGLNEVPRLRGRIREVLRYDESQPAKGVLVSVLLTQGAAAGGRAIRAIRSDAMGRFTINVPREGRYFLVAKRRGLSETQFAARTSKRVDLLMQRAPVVVLRLRWSVSRRAPLPRDLAVHVSPIGLVEVPQRGRVGFFELPVRKRLRFEVRGTAWASPVTLKLKAGQVCETEVRLLSGGAAEGRVLRRGQKAPNRIVYFEGPRGAPRPARTDSEGRFVLRGLAPGRYRINARGQTPSSRARNTSLLVQDGGTLPDLLVELR